MDPNAYTVEQTENLVNLLVGLAWPIVALIALATFRHQLGELLGRIRKGEVFGQKFEFDPAKAEDAVEAAARSATGQTVVTPTYIDDEMSWLRDLAKENPGLAVVGAYAEVEKALRERMQFDGLTPSRLSGMKLIQSAVEAQLIAKPVADALQSLRRLRNAAANGESTVHTAKALDYIDLCDQVRYILMWDRGS